MLILAGHWFWVIELFVTISAKRFELGNIVPITKWFAGMLFAEPYHLHVHTFSICQNGIISFVITRRIKLTNKDRSTWMLV
jgi:hypothetical protein